MPLVVGISGCSRAGKGTLAHALAEEFGDSKTAVICQDRFASGRLAAKQPSGWESTDSIDHAAFRKAVQQACHSASNKIVLVEGFRAFACSPAGSVVDLLDRLIWIDVSRETCRARRMATTAMSEAEFDAHLWPRHEEYAAFCLGSDGPVAARRGTILNGELQPAAVLRAAIAAIRAEPAPAAPPAAAGSSRARSPPTTDPAAPPPAPACAQARAARPSAPSPMAKLHDALAEVEPGTRVGVVTLLGSLCPITRGHVQAFVEARRLLLGEEGAARPARLEPFGAVLGLISLNGAAYVERKLLEKGEASLSAADRLALVQMAVADQPWIATESREGESLGELRRTHPHLSFVHFTMNGADDVRRRRKYTWAGAEMRLITMGRPGDTQAVVEAAERAGVDLDEGHFIMGPELPDISSSEARKTLARGDVAAAAQHLHPAVLDWCRGRGLWRTVGKAPLQSGKAGMGSSR